MIFNEISHKSKLIELKSLKNPVNLNDLCIENICLNLKINYKICIKNKLKIPNFIAEKLFYKILKNNVYIKKLNDENELKIFDKEITFLTRVTLLKTFYSFPNFFNRLDKNQLKNITLNYNWGINLHNDNNKLICINNLLKNTKNLNSFISHIHLKFSFIYKYLLYSIDSLNELKLFLWQYDNNDWKNLIEFLSKCSKLIKINLTSDLNNSINIWNIQKCLLNFKNTLKIIEFVGIKNVFLNKSFLFSLLSLKNLEKLKFEFCLFYEKDDCIDKEFDKIIHNMKDFHDYDENIIFNSNFNVCKSLKDVSFVSNITPSLCQLIGEFLSKCTNIEIIDLSDNTGLDNGLSDICKGLFQSAESLKYIFLKNMKLRENECLFLGNLFQKCSKLEKVCLFFDQHIKDGIKYICKRLLSSKTSLKAVEVDFFKFSVENINFLENLSKEYDINLIF